MFNNELYFQADDVTYGSELWKYDGTNAPSKVEDIRAGSSGGYPRFLFSIMNSISKLTMEFTGMNYGNIIE